MLIRTIAFLVFGCVLAGAGAQTVQRGVVVEAGGGPLAGVMVEVWPGGEAVSNADGCFEFAVEPQSVGQPLVVRSVKKPGYRMLDFDALKRLRINPDSALAIAMCPTDTYRNLYRTYRESALKSYRKEYESDLRDITEQKKTDNTSEEDFMKWQMVLDLKVIQQIKDLDGIIRRAIAVELSPIPTEEKEIFDLFKQGEHESALTRYGALKTITKIDSLLSLKHGANFSQADSITLDSLYAQADRLILAWELFGGYNSVLHLSNIYSNILDSDSTSVDWLLKASQYYGKILGYRDRAITNYNKALQYSEENTPTTAEIYRGLSSVYRQEEKADTAIVYALKNADIIRQLYGTESAEAAEACQFLGETYQAADKFDEAIENYIEALEIRKKLYGPSHPDVIATYTTIGDMCFLIDETEKAYENYSMALSAAEECPFDGIVDTAGVYSDLSNVYVAEGDMSNAITYLNKCLDEREKEGTDSLAIANAYTNIGMAMQQFNQFPAALENYAKALEIIERELGGDNLKAALIYNTIAIIYTQAENSEKALEYYSKALPVFERHLSMENSILVSLYGNLGMTYMAKGDNELAMQYVKKALSAAKKIYGTDNDEIATYLNNIGLIYNAMGEYNMALQYHNMSLAMREKIFGSEHPDVASSLSNIGMVYISLHELDKAMDYYNKAMAIIKQTEGETSLDIAKTYTNIGLIHQLKKEFSEALTNYKKALVIFRLIFGSETPYVATVYSTIGSVYNLEGNYDKALDNYLKALSIQEKIYSSQNPVLIDTYNNIATIYSTQGNTEKANLYFKKAIDLKESIGQ